MTREEAIERIKSRYDKWALDDKDLEAIQCAFPELKKSEDERIRKFLIDILSSGVWRTEWPFSPVDCVAYLERQKEIPMPGSAELIEMWEQEKKMLEGKDFRGDAWRLAYNAFMDGFVRGICVNPEKQKEQPEVNLDADIEMEWDSFNKHLAEYGGESEEVVWLNWNSFNDVARLFYELGLNARKEE